MVANVNIIAQLVRYYGGILLSPTCKINLIYMQHNHFNTQHDMLTCDLFMLTSDLPYVACQHNHLAHQHKKVIYVKIISLHVDVNK